MEDHFTVAFYCTGHGLGHATRSLEIVLHLYEAGHTVTIVTGAPAFVFDGELPPERVSLRHAILDTGAKQSDAFTVDQLGSLEDYAATATGPRRQEIIEEECAWLAELGADIVVSDIVPLACVAAARAGIPCVAVSNFSWDFIYSEYLTAAGSAYKDLVWQVADDYSRAVRLLRLPGHVPMPAFREVVDVPLVVRLARRSRAQVRESLGVPLDAKVAVFIFGGHPPGKDWRLEEKCLPPGWLCLVCSGGKPPQAGGGKMPDNFILLDKDIYTPDVIEASDVVLGKIGYGTASEVLAHRRPLVFLRRDFFNEEPFLRKLLELSDCAVEMKRRDFLNCNWAPYLERAAAQHPNYPFPLNGAEVVASEIAKTAREYRATGGKLLLSPSPDKFAATGPGGAVLTPSHPGQDRLRDTIAWGYMMGRHANREQSGGLVPEWYVRNVIPGSNEGPSASGDLLSPISAGAAAVSSMWEVVEPPSAPLEAFADTQRFLFLLGSLEEHSAAAIAAVVGSGEDQHRPAHWQAASPRSDQGLVLPELRAAAGLFLSDVPVVVTRAPGRLDVMGGIADYSGSLVLQMPIAEAAHVAVQLQTPRRQRLWRHMHARHAAAAAAEDFTAPEGKAENLLPPASLRIVSLGADTTNRGPAFDLDLSELLTPEGEPVQYSTAREMFRRDPALSWAAYVAGGLVVLMREKGVRPEQGIAVLVASEVPEGKGVSSSAAVEVAAMNALAAAHGVVLEGRELAMLCQKVENLIVGAPCGVMDQMASALGEAGSLLALRCQPAEVESPVGIPPHARFWGVDSGIRHSVGGSDYGAVRVGAFMGLKIMSSVADARKRQAAAAGEGSKEQEGGEAAGDKEPALVGNGYLANLPPSAFARSYERHLPETLSGADFLRDYGPHWDSAVTSVDPAKTYAVRQPTAHPIFENFRVAAFRQALAAQDTPLAQQLEVLGELMAQSHVSYSACGLGSDGTDRLVALVEEEKVAAVERGEEPSLYGAKITGGGCGGTVCVLGTADESGAAALKRVIEKYEAETGHAPQVFEGTSQGAVRFGTVRVVRKQ